MAKPKRQIFEDIIVIDEAYEFFMNYLADAERTVELSEGTPLKDFFGASYSTHFDKYQDDKFAHATRVDEFLRKHYLETYPMSQDFRVIAKFREVLFQKMFPDGVIEPLSTRQVAIWGAYLYCAEKSMLQWCTDLRNIWREMPHLRAQESADLVERIVVDERSHVKFAWDLTLRHSGGEPSARRLVDLMWIPYSQMVEKSEALLVKQLKEIILVSQKLDWKKRLLWKGTSGRMQFKTRNSQAKASALASQILDI